MLIAVIFRKINWIGLGLVLAQIDLRWAALGSASILVLIAALALRWRLFLQQQGISLPYGTVFSLTWIGQFFNSTLPGSTGGDVMKIYQVCRMAPDRKAAAASTVFVDRLSALAALLVLVAAALLIDPTALLLLPAQEISASKVGAAVVAIALGGALALWLGWRFLRHTELYGRARRTLAAARRNFTFTGAFAAAVALAFGVHLWNFFVVYLFARSLSIPISYGQLVLIMPVILFVLLIPITINGHGLRELLLIAYFGHLGIVATGRSDVSVQDTAVALSLVTVTNDLLWSLPGGLFYLANFRSRSVRGEGSLPTVPDRSALS